MPEAAEVRIISEYLSSKLLNQRVESIIVRDNYLKKIPKGIDLFNRNLPLKCSGIMTWGKLIICKFHNGIYMTSSLGMSGNWITEEKKHNHVEFKLENGNSIFYNDPRRFGTISFLDELQLGFKVKDLGVDILRESDTSQVLENFKGYMNKNICVALMEQKVLSGVGNYIKAEALFRAKINPHKLVREIPSEQIKVLYKACRDIAQEAYQAKGNSFHSFTDSEGKKGGYSQKLQIYQKRIDPFGNQIIKEETLDGRSTYWSPVIQK